MDLFVAGFARWTWVQSNEQKQICANCCTFKMDACAFVIFSLSDRVPTCLKAVPQTSHLFSLLPRVPFLSPPLSSQHRDAHLSVSSFVAVKVLLARLTFAP